MVEAESGAPVFAYMLLGFVLACIAVYRLGTAEETEKKNKSVSVANESVTFAEDCYVPFAGPKPGKA